MDRGTCCIGDSASLLQRAGSKESKTRHTTPERGAISLRRGATNVAYSMVRQALNFINQRRLAAAQWHDSHGKFS